jgi:excisionase family DNA binding protein
MDTSDDIIRLTEAAQLLDVSLGTMYRMAERGELPGCSKVAGQWRVNRTAMLQGLGLAVAS